MLDNGVLDERFWAVDVDVAVERLESDSVDGLTESEARRRQSVFGANTLAVETRSSRWRQLTDQLTDPIVYLMLAAIAVSLLVWVLEGSDGVPFEALTITAIVLMNTIVGYLQQRRADAAVEALQSMTQPEATVVRGGNPGRIPAADLVPGDLVVLAEGDIVPADCRLVEVGALAVSEATLTGESLPVFKGNDAVPGDAALADRAAMAYSGTLVTSGRGRALVAATGTNTEIGRIAELLSQTESERTPLQVEIEAAGRTLGRAVIGLAALVVVTLLVAGDAQSWADVVDALLIGVSLAVAAVPEGLPAVLTLVLALGVQRMAARNALVKRLVSVEALGSATVILSDKTGTLTRNEMMVRRLVTPSGELEFDGEGYEPVGSVVVDGEPVNGENPDNHQGRTKVLVDEARWALVAARLASDASLVNSNGRWNPVGDPTEAALVAAQARIGVGLDHINERFPRLSEVPFSSERQRMTTVVADQAVDGRLVMAVKGAPDRLLSQCGFERRDGNAEALTEERRQLWSEAVDRLARSALRTLAVAQRQLDESELGMAADELDDNNLVLLGVVGIMDPPRAEAREAIELARGAGIKVAMITGDHPVTATRIADELTLFEPPPDSTGQPDGGQPVLTGPELDGLDDHELATVVRDTRVFARVAPEHKLRIVSALQAQGEVVAMTGDGVNDAPALRAANIGVAMGITGSDVSKEASDMILADDNFATIVEATREGRAIFQNIQSFLRYLLSSNAGEVLTVLAGVVAAGAIGLVGPGGAGVAVPLLAVQILWINLVTDAGPALALGVDPPANDLMMQPPRPPGSPIIDGRMRTDVVMIGLVMAVATLAMIDLKLPGGLLRASFVTDNGGDIALARTCGFTTLVLAQLFNAFNARSDHRSVFVRAAANKWLWLAVAVSLALQIAVVHQPWLRQAFDTSPMSAMDWLVATGLASSVLVVAEIRKIFVRRTYNTVS